MAITNGLVKLSRSIDYVFTVGFYHMIKCSHLVFCMECKVVSIVHSVAEKINRLSVYAFHNI